MWFQGKPETQLTGENREVSLKKLKTHVHESRLALYSLLSAAPCGTALLL